MKWQPIESAPLDTHVIVWGEALRWRGVGGITIGYPHSDYNGHKGRVALGGPCGPTFGHDEVTHWMPLPDPPMIPKG